MSEETPIEHMEHVDIDEPTGDLEAAMREAVAAVEAVEGGGDAAARATAASGTAGDGQAAAANSANPANPADPANPAAASAAALAAMEALRRENAELRDRSLRTLADFDNFRKRAERERKDSQRYALLEPLREFLPIADNLDRALSAGGTADDLKRGVEMILRQMQELLKRFGAREVPTAGEVFNPAVHEAVARTESDDVAVATVRDTMVRGYMLHDRLLRPAMVSVAVPRDKPAPSAAPEASDSDSGSDNAAVSSEP
jgi:molecular chaperone GrpE